MRSEKFKLMNVLTNYQDINPHIPPFLNYSEKTDQAVTLFLQTHQGPFIVRSGLFGEGKNGKLLSGKSLTLKDIHSFNDFKKAQKLLESQVDLQEIIVQKQINWDYHLTVYLEKDFAYITGQEAGSQAKHTLLLSSVTRTGNHPQLELINELLKKLRLYLTKGTYLLEIGLTSHHWWLFQVMSLPEDLGLKIFNDDLLAKLISYKEMFNKKATAWNLLKTEWKAFWFRKRGSQKKLTSVDQALLNWFYILHYFHLFCLKRGSPGLPQDFADFLCLAHKSSSPWPGENLKIHLKLAAKIRQQETTPMLPASFLGQGGQYFFLGTGLYRGKLKDLAILSQDPSPDEIYQMDPTRILLTCSKDILGHSLLAAVERGIPVVAHLPQEIWVKLSPETNLDLDFETKKLVLEYL